MAQNIAIRTADIARDAIATDPANGLGNDLRLSCSDHHFFVDLQSGTEQARIGPIRGAVASPRGMFDFHRDPKCPARTPALNLTVKIGAWNMANGPLNSE